MTGRPETMNVSMGDAFSGCQKEAARRRGCVDHRGAEALWSAGYGFREILYAPGKLLEGGHFLIELSPAKREQLFALHQAEQLFEKLIEQLYNSILKPGDVAIDGGAHVGGHTLPMARLVGPTGEVIAFEPIPPLLDTIMREAAAEGLTNVTALPDALADKPGTAVFHYLLDEPWLSSLHDRSLARQRRQQPIRVSLVALDDYQDYNVTFIKLDLEGAEYKCLLGSRALLARQRPVIAFECGRGPAWAEHGITAEMLIGFFDELDYRLVDLWGQEFTPSRFDLPWDTHEVPHDLVGIPSERADEIVGVLVEGAMRALD